MSDERDDASRGADDADPSVVHRLLDEFRDRLDASLIYAIASDHDASTPYATIRALLLPLAETAAAEQATGFDPSGLGHQSEPASARSDGAATDDTAGVARSSTTEYTTCSEFSDGRGPDDDVRFSDQADLPEDEQVAGLRMIFPHFRDHTIRFVLKHTGGDLERAFDELLNRQFLEETGALAKGVDGFSAASGAASGATRPQTGKANPSASHKARNHVLHVSYSVTGPPVELDEPGRASSPKRRPAPRSDEPPSSPAARAAGLPRSLPSYAPPGDGLLSSRPPPPPAPMSGWQVVSKKTKRAAGSAVDVPDPPPPSPAPRDAAAAHLHTAAALYRKGASHPLYRQAAGVYAERVRADVRAAQEAAFARYNRHVDAQSTPQRVDLHGVPVLDGVRIAQDRVRRWWASLDERERERRTAARPLSIVTGVGHHNRGGVSRLRQAVHAALRNAGWKMEVLTGEFLVTGRA